MKKKHWYVMACSHCHAPIYSLRGFQAVGSSCRKCRRGRVVKPTQLLHLTKPIPSAASLRRFPDTWWPIGDW